MYIIFIVVLSVELAITSNNPICKL